MLNKEYKTLSYLLCHFLNLFIYLRQNIQFLSPNILTARYLNTYIILHIRLKQNDYVCRSRFCFEPDIEIQQRQCFALSKTMFVRLSFIVQTLCSLNRINRPCFTVGAEIQAYCSQSNYPLG